MSITRPQRITGALLASHAADALGATLESQSATAIRERYPNGLRDIVGGGPFGLLPGQATHDTDLTRAVLLAYLDRARINAAGGDPDVASLAAGHMLKWLRGDWPERRQGRKPVHVGKTTLEGLQKYGETGEYVGSGGAGGEGKAGNGSLMRCLPTGLFEEDADRLLLDSVAISAITHADERCTVSCAAYNAIARDLVAGRTPQEAVESGLEVARKLEKDTAVADAIELGKKFSIADMAANGPVGLPSEASGFVLESLAIAVAAVLDKRPLEDVVIDVVRIGGDTDTNAAIAAGLLGARDGEDAVPERWVGRLQFGDDFAEIVSHILTTESGSSG
ncbi:related to ADP-ribosyl-glycohydrolase [Cephalotrichum gorgonifer]|uniref:ADP-ribosylhydrolase ARH3 n=1 Tax=Cephalotrichum gorgonifer TaxID=2041049 RepID=A0AAE8SUJ4_9PEZI|nr:related to ADP-ribosyl-glycohydrolase [Cephalotrichum gorgonifer]